jgi:OmpA-OmpF porin, OOP family
MVHMARRLLAHRFSLLTFGVLTSLLFGCAKKEVIVAVAAPEPPTAEPEPAPAPPRPPAKIDLPGQLEFENNSPYIRRTPETLELLDQLAEILKSNPRITKLRIEGHTDNIGKTKHNVWLSQARADAVARWLGEHDVDPARLVTVGFGDARPVVDNDTSEHRRMNRRTEFHVQELDGDVVDEQSTAAATVSLAD